MSESSPRLASQSFYALVPGASRAINALHESAAAGGLAPGLLEFASLRASQLNGCAYCVQYHTANLRNLGVSDDKLALVVVWREAGIYSAREEAALAWAEELTLLAETHVSDCAYAAARQIFSEQELAALTVSISATNVWNRISVSNRFPVETR